LQGPVERGSVEKLVLYLVRFTKGEDDEPAVEATGIPETIEVSDDSDADVEEVVVRRSSRKPR